MKTLTEAVQIPVKLVRVLIHRTRDREAFEQVKASMADPEIGQQVPIQVRKLENPDAEGFLYYLIVGEGRLTAAKELKWETIAALIVSADNAEIAGRSIAENVIRASIPWKETGRTVKRYVDGGMSIPDICERLHIKENYARKLLRVVNKTAVGLEDVVGEMPIGEAQEFTAKVPKDGQAMVVEFAKEVGLPVAEVARKASAAHSDGQKWTKASLEASIRGVEAQAKETRTRLKGLRLHHALGPMNLLALMKDRKFLAALKDEKINTLAFEEAMK